MARLKKLPVIDVRSFIIGDSDVDIISAQKGALKAEEFGVRKIDFQTPDILNPETELGKNEMLQGYIPAEKIRLGRDGFHPSQSLGEGLKEIYTGKLSVHFASAENFAKSKYAQEGINHPILLALRYLRVQAINYFRTHGKGYPDHAALFGAMDAESMAKVKEIIQKAAVTDELKPLLANNKFKSWINGAIQKSFRSYTNPTAALALMKHFGVDHLSSRFPQEIEPINQYVFNQFRDPVAIDHALKEIGAKKEELYRPVHEYFADGFLYHGTKTEPAFRGILFQGVIPSEGGSGGKGLYGVAEPDKSFSEKWGGDKNRLIQFPISPEAKIVDITQGEGNRIWNAAHLDIETFADRFGIDLIRYPYDTQAFVVKNSGVLGEAQGVYRKVMPLEEILAHAHSITTIQGVLDLTAANNLSRTERDLVWAASKVELSEALKLAADSDRNGPIVTSQYWLEKPEIQAVIKDWLTNSFSFMGTGARSAINSLTNPSAKITAFMDELMTSPKMDAQDGKEFLREFFSHTSHPAPHALDFALGLLPKDQAGRMPEYWHNAQLNPDQGEKLWQAFRDFGGTHKKDGDPAPQIADLLLRNNIHRGEVKDMIVKSLELEQPYLRQIPVSSFFQRTNLLVKYLPDLPETDEQFAQLMQHHLSAIVQFDSGVNGFAFGKVLAQIPHPRKSVALLMEKLGDPKLGDYAVKALGQAKMTDEEWLSFFARVPRDAYLYPALENITEYKTRPKELSRALVKMYFGDHMSSAKNAFYGALRTDPHPEILEGELIKFLKKSPLLKSADLVKAFLFGKLLEEQVIKPSPKFTEPALKFLKDDLIMDARAESLANGLIKNLPLENPSVAARYQPISIAMERPFKHLQAVAVEAERMPYLSPEYREYIKAKIGELKGPYVMDSVDHLERVLAEKPNTPAAIPGTCPGDFAALTK